jgi:hypothetical protein
MLVLIITILSAIGVLIGTVKGSLSIGQLVLSVVGCVVMFYNFKNCREWWEIIMYNVVHIALLCVLPRPAAKSGGSDDGDGDN